MTSQRPFRATLLLGFSLLASAPAFAAVEFKLPVPEIETLSNGLTVVWFVNDSLPVVDLVALVKSGYRDDPAGKTGTAELVSSALDRGSSGMSAQELARAVEMLGASRYSSADDDTFSVGMHGLAPDAPVLLDLLAKFVIHPDFPEAEVAREHTRLLDRWNHIGDYGESLASLAFHRIIAAGTDYGRGNFLSIKEFAHVNRDDVVAFHRTHFTPKNSVLMIVGRVTKPEFREKVKASFGAWSGEAPKRAWVKYADPRIKAAKGQIMLVERADLTQAQVRIGFRAPLIKVPEHYALTVTNALLGEYFNSRLNSIIRDKLALTYGISSSFGYSRDFAKFTISSATRNESVGQLIQQTMSILKDLKHGPIPADEVGMAKDYLIGGFPLGVSTLGAVASRWLGGYIFDRGPEYLNEFSPKVGAVTEKDVLAAVLKDFDLDHLVIVVAGDGKEIGKSLASSNLRAVKRVSVKDLM